MTRNVVKFTPMECALICVDFCRDVLDYSKKFEVHFDSATYYYWSPALCLPIVITTNPIMITHAQNHPTIVDKNAKTGMKIKTNNGMMMISHIIVSSCILTF
jgi:hypothetical protein